MHPLPALPVPALDHRPGHWVVPDTGLLSRRARAAGSGDYRAALPSPIAELALPLPADLAADVADAEAALVALDRETAATLGADSPVLGPMGAILLRTESASSSQIEDLTVGARQLALAELRESSSANAAVVVANVHAMEAALALADRLDLAAVLDMHRALLRDDAVHGDGAGRLREQLVWVGRSSSSPVGARFVAPEAADVPAAMDDLLRFVARTDLPPLLHAALAHAQFETIHPFTDGNGRTGRALVHAMLRGTGLLRTITAPVSAGLLRDVPGYTSALTSYRDGDARPVVEAFTAAARYAAVTGGVLVADLRAELARSRELLRGLRRQATGHRLLPLLVGQPVIDAAYVRRALGVADPTAQRAVAQLVDAGVLVERTGARRNRVWHHPGILAVLDAYAAELRREG